MRPIELLIHELSQQLAEIRNRNETASDAQRGLHTKYSQYPAAGSAGYFLHCIRGPMLSKVRNKRFTLAFNLADKGQKGLASKAKSDKSGE